MKRFRSVAEIDVAVTPMKAKDTILQVLDAKYSKLETINQSLQEKSRNLDRALEDYKFRIIQIEQSKSKLQAEHTKMMLRKQEEFKREVFLNSQKVFSDDASGVFAVTANFQDQEVEALEQEISARTMDRELLIERAYQLEGSIKEIKRHMEINSAEMETLQREKSNINNRYNEIISQNSNETVFNYLKALNTDGGTKYLLNVQQDAVRCEAELAELKRSTEALRAKLSALKSRLKYLKETQQQLDSSQTSVDSLVSTNDKVKEELTDIGERLTAGYEQYKAVSRQLESIDSKLDDVRGAIVEITKTIKVNENQIAESTEKAKKYAGSDDIEQATLTKRRQELEEQRKVQLDNYVSASTARMKVTAAAAEARTLSNLRVTLDHNDLIGLLIRDKVGATLAAATQYLNAFTNGNYTLTEEGYNVVIKDGGIKLSYDNLPQDVKTAVYVSLILSVPNTDVSDGRWIVFEERINIDKNVLADMLLNIDNLSYVVDVSKA